jgi:hypothetical protein
MLTAKMSSRRRQVYAISIYSLCLLFAAVLLFPCIAAAQAQLTVNIPDITPIPIDSSFEIPVYLEDLNVTIAAFEIFIQIDAAHIINFDTSDLFIETGEILDNWTLYPDALTSPTIASIDAATGNNHYYIEPFTGQKLLFKLKGIFASDDPHDICDSSGVFMLSPAVTIFMNQHGSLMEWDYNQGSYFVSCPPCGDANMDEAVNVSDAVGIVNYVFIGADPPSDPREGDVNCDGTSNVSDAVWLINYIFIGGNEPCDPDGDGIPDC